MRYAILGFLLFVIACAGDTSREPADDTPNLAVPSWAKDAIWYQIFVERFRNGDPSNDPTLSDIEGSWPHARHAGWSVVRSLEVFACIMQVTTPAVRRST